MWCLCPTNYDECHWDHSEGLVQPVLVIDRLGSVLVNIFHELLPVLHMISRTAKVGSFVKHSVKLFCMQFEDKYFFPWPPR
jgi:hypothetical protein